VDLPGFLPGRFTAVDLSVFFYQLDLSVDLPVFLTGRFTAVDLSVFFYQLDLPVDLPVFLTSDNEEGSTGRANTGRETCTTRTAATKISACLDARIIKRHRMTRASIASQNRKLKLKCSAKPRIVLTGCVLILISLQLLLHSQVSTYDHTQPENCPGGLFQPFPTGNVASSLDSYNPARHPVLVNIPSAPISVGLVTTHPLAGETTHFLQDGIIISDYLHLVGIVSLYGRNESETAAAAAPELKPTDAKLWIIDGQRVAKLQRPFLNELLGNSSKSDNNIPSWNVLFVDFSDRFQFQLRQYHRLGIWDRVHVRIAVRSIVQDRHYNDETKRIIPGYVAPNLETLGGPMLHAPYAVRSDIVEATREVLQETTKTKMTASMEGYSSLWTRSRPFDVVHMWQISSKEGKSKLRNSVSRAVRSWNGTNNMLPTKIMNRTLFSSIDEQGPRRKQGRNSASQDYVRAMMSAKIVIVTQKDDWEDHYRLFEALVCGALVIADTMLSLPRGLVDGKNIIIFSDLEQLQKLVTFYLLHEEERKAIAKRGWHIAMGRHRSWHRIEELVFGKPLTRVVSP
jgi:hypothetical protein